VIIDAHKGLPAGQLEGHDVCIVGGGPAGITIALGLARRGRSVLLLESGGDRESESARDLNRGAAAPPGSHEPLEENRRRQWGGSSSVWGGRCIPFDDIDFERRAWIELSGWPFSRADLEPHYAEAVELCRAGPMEFDARRALRHCPELLDGLDGDGVVTHMLERWSPPINFGSSYGPELRSAPRVLVVLNATCTHIQLSADGHGVESIAITTPSGDTHRCTAARYVLAAGGLENARLLLHSDDIAPTGIGNHSDCLGRFYQTHVSGCLARMELSSSAPPAHVGFDRDRAGVYCRRRIWINGDRQRDEELLNTVFFPVRPPTGASGHRSAFFSAIFLAKAGRRLVRRPRKAWAELRADRSAIASHAGTLVRHFPSAIPELYRALSGRFLSTRRLPELLPPDGQRSYYLQFQAEQVPHPEARVTLGEEVDELGMRRLVVAPRMTGQDVESVVRAHRILDERLRAANLGRLDYDEESLRAYLADISERVNSAAHFIGTTRMAVDAGDGVVDQDCKVHGVANLYIAGSSVFPTSGHANPTLTLVALAVRLRDHLEDRLKDPSAKQIGL